MTTEVETTGRDIRGGPIEPPAAEPSPKQKPFGYLLTLDLYGCKEGTADDLTLCYDFLSNLVVELSMTAQSPPVMSRSASPDKFGISGWIPVNESGIRIHTLVPKNFVSIDIHSFGNFHSGKVLRFSTRVFNPRQAEMKKIVRGFKYRDVA